MWTPDGDSLHQKECSPDGGISGTVTDFSRAGVGLPLPQCPKEALSYGKCEQNWPTLTRCVGGETEAQTGLRTWPLALIFFCLEGAGRDFGV